jgi:signal transduction histidine kinase
MEHSRGPGERRVVDLVPLIDESPNPLTAPARRIRVSTSRWSGIYEGITPGRVNPQDVTRVLLNLFATAPRGHEEDAWRRGSVRADAVTTREPTAVEIRVRDNGTGIRPTSGQAVPAVLHHQANGRHGLGLSITYDIVTQQHGGSIAVDSEVGEYSESTIRLPRNP